MARLRLTFSIVGRNLSEPGPQYNPGVEQRSPGRYHRLLEEGAEPNESAYAWRSEYNRGSLRRLTFSWKRSSILENVSAAPRAWRSVRPTGYHALHGRVLPTATGAKPANPDLTVIGVGGDGDGYAIGGGHLVHVFKRNPGRRISL